MIASPSPLQTANTDLQQRRSKARMADPISPPSSSQRASAEFLAPLAALTVVKAEPARDTAEALTSIPTYPDLSVKALKWGSVKTYRLWLLLHDRYNRRGGRQLIDEAEARAFICTQTGISDRYWRKLRNEGNGTYWRRTLNGYFIHGTTAVCRQFGVKRLQQQRVYVPSAELTATIAIARKTLYATFHASRDAMPISRATISDIANIARPTQLRYERGLVSAETNYQLIDTAHNAQDATWTYQHSAFPFIDSQGKQGRSGARYIARQMPNAYTTDMTRAPSGRRRKINRALRNRVTKGRAGRTSSAHHRLYYSDGKRAAAAIKRGADQGSYPAPSINRFWHFFSIGSDQTVIRYQGSDKEEPPKAPSSLWSQGAMPMH